MRPNSSIMAQRKRRETLADLGRQHSPREYVSAAGHDCLLPLYDLITRLIGADQAREALLEQADLKAGQRVLDIGCGTGTLAILLQQRHPQLEVVGLDPDAKALAHGRRKAKRAAVWPRFDQGFANALGYASASFDHVFSSFMFHHLDDEGKRETMCEVHRVLRPGGDFHLLDFIASESAPHSLLRGLFHHHVSNNTERCLLEFAANAGFVEIRAVARKSALFGLSRLAYYEAAAPG